jgi:hypothetical protein
MYDGVCIPWLMCVDVYNLTLENPFGMMNFSSDEEKRLFFDRLDTILLSFSLQNLDMSAIGFVPVAECMEWTIKVKFCVILNGKKFYFYSGSGRLNSDLLIESGACRNVYVTAGLMCDDIADSVKELILHDLFNLCYCLVS